MHDKISIYILSQIKSDGREKKNPECLVTKFLSDADKISAAAADPFLFSAFIGSQGDRIGRIYSFWVIVRVTRLG
jgi:hypothetical protein